MAITTTAIQMAARAAFEPSTKPRPSAKELTSTSRPQRVIERAPRRSRAWHGPASLLGAVGGRRARGRLPRPGPALGECFAEHPAAFFVGGARFTRVGRAHDRSGLFLRVPGAARLRERDQAEDAHQYARERACEQTLEERPGRSERSGWRLRRIDNSKRGRDGAR